MANVRTKPHAVLVSFPIQGHVNPTLELACRLVSQNVAVTFVNFENIVSQIQAQPSSQFHDITFVGLPDGLPPDHPRLPVSPEYFEAVQRMAQVFEPFIAKLLKQAVHISCIISDTFVPWTYHVALKFNIPRILLWTSSAASFSVFFHARRLVSKGVIPDPDAPCSINGESTAANEVIDYIPGVPNLLPKDIPAVLKGADFRQRFLISSSQQIQDAKLVLLHSLYELEKKTLEDLREVIPFLAVGPLFPRGSGDDGGDEDCVRWLDGREKASVLYIALGSIYKAKQEEIEGIAAALEATKVPFLWVMGRDSTMHTNVLEGFIERTKHYGLLIPWAPQKKILAHPSIGGFLSHCGWNSTLESIWAGVPLIAWPRDSEQHLNSKFLVDHWQVAIPLPSTFHHDDVSLAIRTLMCGEVSASIRHNVKALSHLCSNAKSSDENLQMFIKSLESVQGG